MEPVNKAYSEASKHVQSFYVDQYRLPYIMAAANGILGLAGLLKGSKISFFVASCIAGGYGIAGYNIQRGNYELGHELGFSVSIALFTLMSIRTLNKLTARRISPIPLSLSITSGVSIFFHYKGLKSIRH
jgi:uncharacterized membrane protein (UPF0136 family)